MSLIRLLTFTTLYPNAAQPHHGVFVENRLRHLLEHPPGPGGALPAKVTLAASIPLRSTNGRVGTLNVTPSGAAWYAGRTFAATMEEIGPVDSPAAVERAGAILAMDYLPGAPLRDALNGADVSSIRQASSLICSTIPPGESTSRS